MEIQHAPRYRGMKQVFAVSLGLFLVFLDSTIVNVSLPTIMQDYTIDLNLAAWIINSFVLTLSICLITFGKLADLFGRVNMFLFGVFLFAGSSLFCGLAPTIELLIISRILQGVAGAMIIPTSMMLVRTAVPAEKTGFAMGIWGAIGALAVAMGPSIGGVLTEYIHWRWIFYINVPIILISLPFLLWVFKGNKEAKQSFNIDIGGILFLSLSLYFFTYAILQGEKLGWTSKVIYLYFSISIITALLFIWLELKVKTPLIDFSIFKNKHYLGGIISNFLSGLLVMGTLILLPIYLTQIKGYSTLTSSLLITPLSAVMLVVAPLIGKLIDKIGYVIPMAIGYLFTIVGFLKLLTINPDTKLSALIITMALVGTGLGILMVASVTICTATVENHHISLGSGIFATARNMGGAIGVSLFVSITMSYFNQYSADIYNDGISTFENAAIPQEVKALAIQSLETKKASNFEESNTSFTVSKELSDQMVQLKKQEILNNLPAETAITPELEANIMNQINNEMGNIQNVVQTIQKNILKDLFTALTNALNKAFLSGLLATCLFSLSLPLLRKR